MSKKSKRVKKQFKTKEEIKSNIPEILKSNYLVYSILFLIVSLAFYVRGIVPYEATFAGGVTGFAMDDSVFHMRLVENLLYNYPHRITYDAFTNYPYGSVLSWGSFFDLIIASLVLIFGVDKINIVGALVPAVMGALVSIPIYFIGRELYNKKAGLFAALIVAILPGAFLQRSIMGFTDNHVAEVLFSTTFLMFTMFAIKNIEEKTNKYSILAGIFLGLYIITWSTGLIFSGMLALFIILKIIMNHINNVSSTKLLKITNIIYGISAIMVIPFLDIRNSFSVVYYSFTHILAPISVMILCTTLVYISKKLKEMKMGVQQSVLVLFIITMIFYLMIKTIFPGFFLNTFGSLSILFDSQSVGRLTIGEGQPTSLAMISSYFGTEFLLSVFSFFVLVYYLIRNKNDTILLMLIWTTFLLYALFAQNRFFYYFAINISILSGVTCGIVLDYIGKWKNIKIVNSWNITTLLLVIFVVGFYPIGNSMYDTAIKTTQYGVRGEGFYEWHESLAWMRNNTPDPGLDYYGTYERPNVGEKYNYPDSAYGVMSWWDYGHIITYWAHRIPNANPFQSGIGSSKSPGAAPFLTTTKEEEANKILDILGSKYVVSNGYMAYSIQPIFAEWMGSNVGYFNQIRTSQGVQIVPSEKLYNTMESKLHIFDTNNLKNYRLVHESAPNQYVRGGSEELAYKQIYNLLINSDDRIPIESSGFVKIFEYVRGANITGKTTPNSEVAIKLNIVTNVGRKIIYTQKTKSNTDGDFVFTVPYSTSEPLFNGTQYDTKADGKYELILFGKNQVISDIEVDDKSVLNGESINIQ